MIRQAIAVTMAAALLTACGPRVRTVYEKPGATQSEYDKANFECQRDARVVMPGRPVAPTYGGGIAAGIAEGMARNNAAPRIEQDDHLFALCMKAAGFTATRVSTPRR